MHVRGTTNSNSCHNNNNNPCDANTRTAACLRPLLSPSSRKKLSKKAFNSCLCSKTRIAWLCVCVCVCGRVCVLTESQRCMCECWAARSNCRQRRQRRHCHHILWFSWWSFPESATRSPQHAPWAELVIWETKTCRSADNSLNLCVFLSVCF